MKLRSIGTKTLLLTMAVFFLSTLSFAQTPQEKGLQLMKKVEKNPVFEKTLSETTFHIYDGQGKKLFSKKSRSAAFMNNYKDSDKRTRNSIAYFYAPADDKGNGSLSIENEDKDDDQWIYLKGLRKPKRIVGSDKSSSFMGSDFSNGDVSGKDIDDSNYKWIATEKATSKFEKTKKGKKSVYKKKTTNVEKIEAVFKEKQKQNDYGYSKTIFWIHVKSGLPFKAEYYDLNGQLSKKARLISFTIKKNRDGKKVFIPTSLEMKNMLKGTKTVMRMKNIKTEKKASKVKKSMFKVEYLTRKWW